MTCHIQALCAVSSEDLPLRTSVHLSYIAFFVQREIPLKFSVIEKGTLSIFSNFQNSLVSLHYSDFSTAGSSVIGDSVFFLIWLRALQILLLILFPAGKSSPELLQILLQRHILSIIHPVGRIPHPHNADSRLIFLLPLLSDGIPGLQKTSPWIRSFHFM